MFKFINDRFKALSLPVALVTLTLACFVFALVGAGAAFYWYNGSLPANLVAVVAIASAFTSIPMILQSMPTIKYLQNSRERLQSTTGELERRVAQLDAAYHELKVARSDLERRVEERTRDLDEARRDAETASRAKSDFLARMSHELRTPLNAVIGFSELLSHPSALPPQKKLGLVEDYAGTIHRSGTHLLSLVNDLLDLSKIEAGEMSLTPEDIEIGPFVEDIRGLVAVSADTRGQTLRLYIGPPGELLRADRRAMKQIMLNLLSNAMKYSPDGTTVTLTVLRKGDTVVFEVADEGYGMAPEDLGRALEPFSRLPNGDRAGVDGTGLGLPIVASLVEAQGGTMSIQSAVDVGTTVTVSLPSKSQFFGPDDDRRPSAVA